MSDEAGTGWSWRKEQYQAASKSEKGECLTASNKSCVEDHITMLVIEKREEGHERVLGRGNPILTWYSCPGSFNSMMYRQDKTR